MQCCAQSKCLYDRSSQYVSVTAIKLKEYYCESYLCATESSNVEGYGSVKWPIREYSPGLEFHSRLTGFVCLARETSNEWIQLLTNPISYAARNRGKYVFVFGATAPQWARASSFTRLLDHIRRTTVGRTPLDE
jgi:hypothetical protein